MTSLTSIPPPEAAFEGTSPPLVESTCGDDGRRHVKKNRSAVGCQPQLQSLHQQNNDEKNDIKSSSPALQGKCTAINSSDENNNNGCHPQSSPQKACASSAYFPLSPHGVGNGRGPRRGRKRTFDNNILFGNDGGTKLYRTLRPNEDPREGGLLPAVHMLHFHMLSMWKMAAQCQHK